MSKPVSMPILTVRAIGATPVEVPMTYVLGTSAGAVRKAPLLLVDLETGEGITGRAYLFCYLPAAAPAIMSILREVETPRPGTRWRSPPACRSRPCWARGPGRSRPITVAASA